MHETTGLRERKKAETRAALSDAALRLAVERGIDAVTADAIADAAGVSVRTFHNYFASKDEAILEPFRDVLGRAVDGLRARPADEPILDALEAAWLSIAVTEPGFDGELATHVAALWSGPQMASYQHRLVREAIRLFVGPVAERTGTDPATDLYPHVVTTAAVAALFSVLELRPSHLTDPSVRVEIVDACFALLRNGFQPPGRPTG